MTRCGQQIIPGHPDRGEPEFCDQPALPDLGVCRGHAETYDPDEYRDRCVDMAMEDQ